MLVIRTEMFEVMHHYLKAGINIFKMQAKCINIYKEQGKMHRYRKLWVYQRHKDLLFLWIFWSFGDHFCAQDAANKYHCHLITSHIELFFLCICKIIDFFYCPLVYPWYFFVIRLIQRTVHQPAMQLMQSSDFCCASICIVFCNFKSAWLWFSTYSIRRGSEEIFISIMHVSLSYF